MSKQGLERTANFIADISEDKEFDKAIIGNFNKYTVFVISNDGPYFYFEHQADSEWDDVLYRFNLLGPGFDGMGEFEEWDEFYQFLEENWAKIIYNYNILNNKEIINNGIIDYGRI